MQIYLNIAKGNYIRVRSEINGISNTKFKQYLEVFHNIPNAQWKSGKTQRYWLVGLNYYDRLKNGLEEIEAEIIESPRLLQIIKSNHARVLKFKRLIREKLVPYESSFFTGKLRPFQTLFPKVAQIMPNMLLADQMGLGKTVQVIAHVCKLYEDEPNLKVFVVCPTSLKYQWKNEILKFTRFKSEDIFIVDRTSNVISCMLGYEPYFGTSEQCRNCEHKSYCAKLKQYPRFRLSEAIKKQPTFLITNYESVDIDIEVLSKVDFDVVVLDECTYIKNNRTKRHKALCKLRGQSNIALSGRPMENGMQDIFGIYQFLDPSIFGNWWKFVRYFFKLDQWGKPIKILNEQELKKIIDSRMLRRTLEEVWKDRPELEITYKSTELEGKQRELYHNFYYGAVNNIKDMAAKKQLRRADVAPLMIYLREICSCPIIKDPTVKTNAKLEMLKEVCPEIVQQGHKAVVYVEFLKTAEVVTNTLNTYSGVVTVTGGNIKDRTDLIDKFQNDEKINFMVATNVVAYGANLQQANYVINYDLIFNPAKLEQRIHRIYRFGQKHKCIVINMYCENTIEERVLEVLKIKDRLFNEFIKPTSGKEEQLSLTNMLDILRVNV